MKGKFASILVTIVALICALSPRALMAQGTLTGVGSVVGVGTFTAPGTGDGTIWYQNTFETGDLSGCGAASGGISVITSPVFAGTYAMKGVYSVASGDDNEYCSSVFTGQDDLYLQDHVYYETPSVGSSNIVQRKSWWFSDSTTPSSINGNYSDVVGVWNESTAAAFTSDLRLYFFSQSGTCGMSSTLVQNLGQLNHDTWYKIGIHLHMNTPSTSDGYYEIWINDAKWYKSPLTDQMRGTCSGSVSLLAAGEQLNVAASTTENRYHDSIEVSSACAACGTALVTTLGTDNFNRSDSTNIGTNWGDPGGRPFQITSNQLGSSAGSNVTIVGWDPATPSTDDQWSQLTVSAIDGSTLFVGACVRCNGSGGGESGYFLQYNTAGTTLYRGQSGSYTNIGTSGAPTVGDTMCVEAIGNQIDVRKNGSIVIGPVTDSNLTGGLPGIAGYGTGTTVLGDDWKGGNVVSGVGGCT